MTRWTGIRLELACGHYSLEDGTRRRDIGQAVPCRICPGAPLRHIVSVAMVGADSEPEYIGQGS